MLHELPASAADREFINSEEAKARACIESLLAPDDDEPIGSGIITERDKLRFIVLLCKDEVIAAYLRAHRVLGGGPRGELSRRNSNEREPEWYELLVALFNDPDQEARTDVLSTLHSKFADAIDCPKGNYDLTDEKAKKLIDTMKHHLRVIIERYNTSGNGSDMRIVTDVDSDCDDVERAISAGNNNRTQVSYIVLHI